jgi:hypothetical protein
VKHCVALLDVVREMRQGAEGGEEQVVAAKAVAVLALTALDGDALCSVCKFRDCDV